MPAHAAPSFVARQIVAIDVPLDGCNGVDQARGEFRRQKLRQIQKFTLVHKLSTQLTQVEASQAMGDRIRSRLLAGCDGNRRRVEPFTRGVARSNVYRDTRAVD